jgi:LPS-assembly lipoprotein
MGLNRRTVLAAALAPALSACGFQLRKAPDFAFSTIFIGAAEASTLGNEAQAQHRFRRRRDGDSRP